MTPPLRAAGLVRVSTEAQAERGYGLEDQPAAIRAYAERHGITLVGMEMDDGVSGRMRDRPAIRAIRQLAETQAIDAVILVKLDRLGRENRVIQELLGQFRDQGLRVLFTEHSSGDTPADRLLLNVLGGVAEFDFELIRARLKGGKHQKALAGLFPSRLHILGYDVLRRWQEQAGMGKSGTLVVNEPEAALVRLIYARYDDGLSTHALARVLNAAGHRTKNGGEWEASGVRRILGNAVYRGELVYGREEWYVRYEDGRAKRNSRPAPEEAWVRIPVPPIIDLDLWERTQRRLQDRAESYPGRPSTVWPLRGVVYCADCKSPRHGVPVTCTGLRQSRHPRHANYQRRRYQCESCWRYVFAEELEARALKELRRRLRPGVLAAAARKQAEKERAALGDIEGEIAMLERGLAALDAEERGVARMVAAGIAGHLVGEEVRRLHQRRADLQSRLRETLARAALRQDPEEAAERAEEIAARTRQELDAAGSDPARLQALFRRHVRIILGEKGAEIRVFAEAPPTEWQLRRG